MFQFVKQTPELICMNGFSVCFELSLLEIFIYFRINLQLRILTSYLVAFLCFLELLFEKRATISTLVGSATSPAS